MTYKIKKKVKEERKKAYEMLRNYGVTSLQLEGEKKFYIPKKKIYYYKIVNSRGSKYGGKDETAEVFEVQKGKIAKIGEVFWQTRGYKGEEGEVMDVLLKEKKISEDEYNKSKSKQTGGGYYRQDLNNFKIERL